MYKKEKIDFSQILFLLRSALYVQLIIVALMTIFRLFFYFSFAPESVHNVATSEILNAFWFGSRLDLSIVAYASVPIVLLSLIVTFLQNRVSYQLIKSLFIGYLFIIDVLISLILAIDYGYYAFFNEHISIFIFGFFNDDTTALLKIFWKNYPAIKIVITAGLYIFTLLFIIRKIFSSSSTIKEKTYKKSVQSLILVAIILSTVLAIRGTLGIFPIFHWIKDISSNHFVNQVRKDSVYSLIDAINYYEKSLKSKRNFVKEMGFEHNISAAFKIVTNKKNINLQTPEKNLLKTTPYNKKIEEIKPNVVVIQVESFGTPILKYQSNHFDIMRHLKKHFQQDTLFTNFISAANGTIVSMEPMLLNLVARPNTIPYGQSKFKNLHFPTAAASVYKKNGYDTRYLYGGDLSWRNVGGFFPHQGFNHVEGKVKIAKSLNLNKAKYFHDWGVYDQFLYKYILKTLKEAKTPQFIYAMTTNNHPPFELYKDYKSKKLIIDANLSKHLKGERSNILKRLYDYQYALDMAGKFLDAIKSSPLAKNTVVVITADNNTFEGHMKYDNFYQESKQIPFYIYLPPALKPKCVIDTTVPGSHKDLFATLYNFTLSNATYMSVGSNLLDKSILHCGINEAGVIISDGGAFQAGNPHNDKEKQCDLYRKATIAITDYLVKNWYGRSKI